LWVCTYMMTNTVNNWLPTLYRTTYHLSLQETLNLARYALLGGMVVEIVCALTIDRVGRRFWFVLDFGVCTLCCILFYAFGTDKLISVILYGWTFLAFSATASFSLYLYTTEIYPTRLRAVGVSVATIWARVAAFIGPLLVGSILPQYGVVGIFVLAGILSTVGLVVTIWLVVEGKRKILEVLSP
jgi:putative MFS transporter